MEYNSNLSCGALVSLHQTPEKKANDQRSRKRKGDIYDSNSQGESNLLTETETALNVITVLTCLLLHFHH